MTARTLESYFIDWEGEVFGFGYGSGEPHIIPALRKFFELCPSSEVERRNYDYVELECALTPTVAWLLINILAKAKVIEYGTSPRFAWLTERGYRLRDFVLSKTADELVAVVTEYDLDAKFCCSETHCNCSHPQGLGYVEGAICPNPFFREKLT